MIKPLLRTIPTLSGNVKLACTLLDYNKLNANTFETNIRGAHIYPISSQLFQKSVEANLLSSSWEFDLKRFYEAYSDIFHNHCFVFNYLNWPSRPLFQTCLLNLSLTPKMQNRQYKPALSLIGHLTPEVSHIQLAHFFLFS